MTSTQRDEKAHVSKDRRAHSGAKLCLECVTPKNVDLAAPLGDHTVDAHLGGRAQGAYYHGPCRHKLCRFAIALKEGVLVGHTEPLKVKLLAIKHSYAVTARGKARLYFRCSVYHGKQGELFAVRSLCFALREVEKALFALSFLFFKLGEFFKRREVG